MKNLVMSWLEKWDQGDFLNIPISNDFKHTSPYGTIEGKIAYLRLVESNKDKFLGNEITLRDEMYSDNKACIRYTIKNNAVGFAMEVSEWFYKKGDLIGEIVAYYNIEGEISESRKLESPD